MSESVSGTRLQLGSGDAVAVIDRMGSALIGLELAGVELIALPGEPPHPYHGVTLAPWPNRIKAGRYSFDGVDYQLPLNEDFGNALHGFSFGALAEVTLHSANQLVLSHDILPSAGYPFELRVTLSFELADGELWVTTACENLGNSSCPVGLGTHPFFKFDAASTLEVRAERAAVHGADMLPIAEIAAAEIGFGAGQARSIDGLPLDVQFTAVSESCAVLTTESAVVEVLQQGADWLMVYTTETFNWADGPGRAVAIEPQTCAADAFNTGLGLRVLAPGESFSYRWGVRARKR